MNILFIRGDREHLCGAASQIAQIAVASFCVFACALTPSYTVLRGRGWGRGAGGAQSRSSAGFAEASQQSIASSTARAPVPCPLPGVPGRGSNGLLLSRAERPRAQLLFLRGRCAFLITGAQL